MQVQDSCHGVQKQNKKVKQKVEAEAKYIDW
jgi:hypothetical protein